MANFKVGDEVICIDAMPEDGDGQIVRGGKYIVAFVDHAAGCVALSGLFDCDFDPLDGECQDCGVVDPLEHHDTWRFIKLDGLLDESDERHTEKLEA